jgi:hypothetical protein
MAWALVCPAAATPRLKRSGSVKPSAWVWHEAQETESLVLRWRSKNRTRPRAAPALVRGLFAGVLSVEVTAAA